MKRAAERQMTKGDEEEEAEEGQHGFKKADSATMADRPVRGLPKRGSTMSSSKPELQFGVANSSSFTFVTPPVSPAPTALASTPTRPTLSKAAQALGSLLQANTIMTPPPAPSGPSDASKRYFLSMRGLNRCFLKQLGELLEDDPFLNLAEHHFDLYKNYRLVIETERQTAEAAAAERAKPPPPSFSKAFGQPASGAVPPPALGSKFTFSGATASNSAFSFPPVASPSGAEANVLFKPSATALTLSSSPFATAPSPFGATALGSPFGVPASASASVPSLFGTASPFGTPASGPMPTASLGPSAAKEVDPTPAPTNFFSPSSGGALSAFVGFGKPSTPGSVVFGFGTPKTEVEKETEPEKQKEDGQETTVTASSEGDGLSRLIGNGAHDVEGEGEENEETTHSIKLKAFKMSKDNDGNNSWTELGVGFLRLKRNKETDVRRMLLRNSTSGKIHINFRLYSGLAPSQITKNSFSVVGHDAAGGAQTYLLRTKTEEQTTELKDAIQREIEFVKAKNSDA